MAEEIEQLVVTLSARVQDFERNLARAQGISLKQARAIERNFTAMQKRLDVVGRASAAAITRPLAGIAAALGTRQLIQMTAQWTDMNSGLRLVSGGAQEAEQVLEQLSEAARRTNTDIGQLTQSYIENATELRESGASLQQSVDYIETLNAALDIGAIRGQRAETVLSAMAKAMALGTLQGTNLNSVIQQGGRLAEALAESMGVGVTELRRLGMEGKIGRREMLAITSQMAKLRDEAAAMPTTIVDGFTRLNNALLEYVGRGDEATGISERIADALVIIADNFDTVADTALKVAAVIAGALVGRSIGGMVRTLGTATVVVKNFGLALAGLSSAGGVAGAFGGLAAAAGPLGALFGGLLAGGLVLYAARSGEAERKTDALREAMESFGVTLPEVASSVDDTTEAVDRLNTSLDETANAERIRQLQVLQRELEALSSAPEGPRVKTGDELNLEDVITRLRTEYEWLRQAGDEVGSAAAESILAIALAVEQGERSVSDLVEAVSAVDLSQIPNDLRDVFEDIRATSESMGVIALTIDVGEADVQLAALREQIARIRQAIIDTGDVDMAAALLPQLDEIEDGLDGTEDGARRAEAAISALMGGAYSASPILGPLAQVAAGLGVIVERAVAARAALAAMGAVGGGGMSASDRARDAGRARAVEEAATRAFITSQRELNARTSEQITLDREMAGVRSQAIADGIALSEQQIEMLAREKIAADEARRAASSGGRGGGGGGRGTADRGITSGEDQIRQLERELLLVGQSSEAVARLRAEWAMLDEARRAGIPINAELQALISQQADEVGRLTGELERAQTSQEAFNARMEDIAGTFADAIIAGESLQSALASIFQQIARDLLQSGILALLKQLGGALGMGGGGGGGGGFLSFLGLADGGVMSGPGISAYSGQVVNKPTVFPFAKGVGLMGEAGPEAIMPLTRIGGKLGVRAERGSSPEGLVRVIIEEAPGFATRVRTEAQGVAVQVVSAAARSQADSKYLTGGG